MRPPAFERKCERNLLLYVDVNISPSKTGRIGIYEGDDLRQLAKNFCKAFQLNRDMMKALVKLLRKNFNQYTKEHSVPVQMSMTTPLSPIIERPPKSVL
jgi:hypothetical protein